MMPRKPKTIITSQAVLDAVADRPRHHLGDFIYESDLQPSRLVPSHPTQRGFASNPKPLPWNIIKDKENSILTVKVPRIHLTSVAREEITARAAVWGTDVYTDDSDIVAACIHSGWIKGAWSEDFEMTTLDLEEGPETKRRKTKNHVAAGETVAADSEGLITAPPPTGPMVVPAERDLHVNVLILPRLLKYASITRFGVTSREFGGEFGERHAVHDGLSYMILSVRWVENGGQPQSRLRGAARRERMRKAMREVKSSVGNAAAPREQQGSNALKDKDKAALVSGDVGRMRGQIMGNPWKVDDEATKKKDHLQKQEQQGAESDGNKENQHVSASNDAGGVVRESADKDTNTESRTDGDVPMGDALADKEGKSATPSAVASE